MQRVIRNSFKLYLDLYQLAGGLILYLNCNTCANKLIKLFSNNDCLINGVDVIINAIKPKYVKVI